MEIMETKKNEKNDQNYNCTYCDFECSYLCDWTRHVSTRKHLVSLNGNQNGNKLAEKNETNYQCISCNKKYKSCSGLWKHKKICELIKIDDIYQNHKNEEIIALTEFVKDIVKQNQELTNKLFDMCKNNTIISNSNTINTNSHNKTFNLNVFLNETCKDAMNIMDFVDSLKIQLSDLENIGKLGFVEGISSIIVKNLNSLDESKRPVHCTDSKREVMYIKDDDKWEKENEHKHKLRKAIKHIAHKNTKLLPEFRQKYPNCDKSESKLSEKYNKLVIEAFGGKGDNDDEKENKIIHNIAKEVVINKT